MVFVTTEMHLVQISNRINPTFLVSKWCTSNILCLFYALLSPPGRHFPALNLKNGIYGIGGSDTIEKSPRLGGLNHSNTFKKILTGDLKGFSMNEHFFCQWIVVVFFNLYLEIQLLKEIEFEFLFTFELFE